MLSESGTLYKYIVDNFTVKSATVRYYDISAIYRTYYTAIDGEETGENTTSELAIAVAQCWAVGELNGETYYDMEETKVVTINAYAGFIRYWTGSPFNYFTVTNNYVDSHFVAFDCDYDIEELYEADISFYLQSYWYYSTIGISVSESYDYEDIDTTYYDTPLTIDCGDTVSYESIGYFGVFSKATYSWDRISTVDEFLENLESNDGCSYSSDFINNISGKQWVVRFYETEFSYTSNDNDYGVTYTSIHATEVTDVTVLRLKFLSDGEVYNLGVVSNKITESSESDVTVSGITPITLSSGSNWEKILAVIALVLLCILFAPLLPYVAKFIVWVISLPFKLIDAIIQAVKSRSDKPKKE